MITAAHLNGDQAALHKASQLGDPGPLVLQPRCHHVPLGVGLHAGKQNVSRYALQQEGHHMIACHFDPHKAIQPD
jgi:hypothetical protein